MLPESDSDFGNETIFFAVAGTDLFFEEGEKRVKGLGCGV